MTDAMTDAMIEVAHVRAAADLVGLPLTDQQARELVGPLAHWTRLGEKLMDATTTDVLPTDCPTWPAA